MGGGFRTMNGGQRPQAGAASGISETGAELGGAMGLAAALLRDVRGRDIRCRSSFGRRSLSGELMGRYQDRPPYQRNDYIGWITRAKREATRQKRLAQMLDELERGDKYMNMDYRHRRPPR